MLASFLLWLVSWELDLLLALAELVLRHNVVWTTGNLDSLFVNRRVLSWASAPPAVGGIFYCAGVVGHPACLPEPGLPSKGSLGFSL